ncbi:hypothetical protein [Bifidobacterium callitrichos]|uniref:Uncharacterized protein n=1 Tax=Bifidobacterium callitrichos DSM 23973 TaxID=1437609 RepID=A0A087ACR7_9BIFI|nr:hypothetical protein [Bifidobacterium callitrichos]KFI56567.1 hypothetical protein BCAL_0162 [Bifidobacterium callitrichos DSM 23973]
MSRKFEFESVAYDTVFRVVERRNGEAFARWNARVIKTPSWDETGTTYTITLERTTDPANSGTLYLNE